MKILVIGGTGAMGLIFGARLAQAGHDVTLLDVNKEAVDFINKNGAKITDKNNETETIPAVNATCDTTSIGKVDLAIGFTKCYSTEAAVKNALPCFSSTTTILSLQNGWGNYDVISGIVDPEQIIVGVNYVSGTTLGPGHAKQVGNPVAFIGRVNQKADEKVRQVADVLNGIYLQTTASDNILHEIYGKLALNIATLPTAAILNLEAHKLIENEYTINMMDDLLKEFAVIAQHQGIPFSFEERRNTIHNLLKNAVGARGSMLQDIAAKRKTEIDVINGAIVNMGKKAGIATPFNQAMVYLVKAMEQNYL
jgi:2-dehydropantoate 2-reductase